MGALRFSPKQRQVLTWWREGSPHWEKSAIICDGAVRSGKTLCLGLSFFLWAMARFQGRRFALCGRSMEGVRRNLTGEVLPPLRGMGFQCREQLTRGEVTVSLGRRRNIFCLFGGGDEGAAARIQGVTLAGALLDEAVLMPRSFVEQCCARCSVQGARLWFSCNPEGPGHWFYQEWVQKAGERNALYLHFTMEDNPGLPRCGSDTGPCSRGPSTAGSCWGNGPRRQGWYMTSSPGRWCASRRRGGRRSGISPATTVR